MVNLNDIRSNCRPSEPGRGVHWAWIILCVCFFNLLINYAARNGYSLIFPEMIRTLGFGRTDGGTIYNAYLFVYILCSPVAGFFADRFGTRRIIIICLAVLGMGLALMGTVHTVGAACMSYAVAGIGASGMWTPVLALVQRWFTPMRRGMALGILSSGFGLGFALMGALFPWIAKYWTWRGAWFLLAGAAIIMLLVNLVLLRENPESCGTVPWGGGGQPVGNLSEGTGADSENLKAHVFANRIFWIVGASYFAISYAVYGITTFMVDFARLQAGLSFEKASFLASIHGVCQLIGVLSMMPLSDVFGRKRMITISNLCIALALAGILIAGTSWQILYVLIGVIGLFFGVTFVLYGACAGDYFPRRYIGTVIGAWTPFYGLGAIFAHWITGMICDSTGSYALAFFLNMIMAVAGLLLICLVPALKEKTEP